tara:strand:+ start:69 stop:1244 length:1176 start_codon:yes stop_codon:yes gene_type:complete
MIKSISIYGCGYVGATIGYLLAKTHQVNFLDIDAEKINLINKRISPIQDRNLTKFIEKNTNLSIKASIFPNFEISDLHLVAVPTDYSEINGCFNTEKVEEVISFISKNDKQPLILIKSTVPVGFTDLMKKKYKNANIIFSPEFLRENNAIDDNLNPSRIIIGEESENGRKISKIFFNIAQNKPPVFFMNSNEAEALKLFANTYLAMRVAFFNELDTFSIIKGLDVKKIINGISADNRIGNYYNNPSFGYGGYCLPKDSKQLLANYKNIPQNIMKAIVDSNDTRKKFIVDQVLSKNKDDIGIYKLDMKKDSANARSSAIVDIIHMLKDAKKNIVIFDKKPFDEFKEDKQIAFTNNINVFLKAVDLIIANRIDDTLSNQKDKLIFTRDIFNEN